MLTNIEAIHVHQLNTQGDGTVTVSIVKPFGIKCLSPDRDAIVGDVLSVTPDGAIVARPAGTAAAWEKAKIVGSSLVFAPNGATGPAFRVPYVAEIPNG